MMFQKPKNWQALRGKSRGERMRLLAMQRHMEKVKKRLKEEREKMNRIEEESRIYRLQKTKDKEQVKTEDVLFLSESNMIASSKLHEDLLKKVRTSELEDLILKQLTHNTLLDHVEVALDVAEKKERERKRKFQPKVNQPQKEAKKSTFVERLLKEKLHIRR